MSDKGKITREEAQELLESATVEGWERADCAGAALCSGAGSRGRKPMELIRHKCNGGVHHICECREAHIAELEAALKRYGLHEDGCMGRIRSYECSCGLTDAKRSVMPRTAEEL